MRIIQSFQQALVVDGSRIGQHIDYCGLVGLLARGHRKQRGSQSCYAYSVSHGSP
jgi:hypothetical protein